MGKGKGAPEYWVACIKPGTILFEAAGVSLDLAKEALSLVPSELNH
jgi:large subunit ribosomal protein L16